MTLARRMSRIKPSAIRELLKVAERPDVLSFAGGLPAPEAFPAGAIARSYAAALAEDPGGALQYGSTEGYGPLRSWVVERMGQKGLALRVEQVLITAGSQQGIDLAARTLLDPGDLVVVESPSYLAALQAFQAQEASFAVVGTDEHGMKVDELERLLRQKRPKLIYLVPTFQNPRGTTLSLERRHALARLAMRFDVPILEDDPYAELRYSGEALPPIAALEPRAKVIYLSSFSKTLAPGLRVAWACGPEDLIRAMTVSKQSADLHTGTLAQRALVKLLEFFDYDGHIQSIRGLYRDRRDAMLASLESELPGATLTVPDGGLFIWARLPDGLDATALLDEAVREKVAFVPGAPFFPRDPDRSTMRLNFSNRPPELIRLGMARLGAVVARRLGTQVPRVATA